MASERANPRMAYENSCCLSEGFLAYPMMSEPKTDPIPAPEPATPTVAAPAPMNLAALSMSLRAVEVWRARVWTHAGAEDHVAGLVTAVDLRRLLEQGVITNRAMLAMASESGDFWMGNEKCYGD